MCHCAAQSHDQPGSLGWHVPRHRPAEAWEPREGMRRPLLLLFMLCRGGQSLSLAPVSPSSSEALGASEPTGDAGASSIPRRPARPGRAGGRAMLKAGAFRATTLALLDPWPLGLSQQKPQRRVTAGAGGGPWSWPWQGGPAGAGVAPLRAEPSSAAGCCTRMMLGCADPPTALVRGAAARRGCGHGGAEGGFAPICHHPGPAAASASGKELDLPDPAQGCATAHHEAEEDNRFPPKYRGDVEKSTESSQGWKKTIPGFGWIQPRTGCGGRPAAAAPGARALVPGQGLCPGIDSGRAGERQRLGGDTDPVQAGATVGRFWGCAPCPVCVRAQGGEGLWAGGSARQLKHREHPTAGFGGWWFFFFPISSKAVPGQAFTRFLR